MILLVDDPEFRKAGKPKAWVENHAHEIDPGYLPSCAPDHSPSGYLIDDPRQQLRQQPQPGSEQEPIERTRTVRRASHRSPERLRACFRPEPVPYAALAVTCRRGKAVVAHERIEMITSVERRRRRPMQEKLRLMAESHRSEGGVCWNGGAAGFATGCWWRTASMWRALSRS